VGRAIKINVTIPPDELKKVDAFVQRMGATRSRLIQQALDHFMEEKETEDREKERRRAAAKAAAEIRELATRAVNWNGGADTRKQRATG
jgi:metal-responsive CopG/Arc/MetJ family transcriptional regulator